MTRLHRFAGHAAVLGITVLALVLTRPPSDQTDRPPMVTAAFNTTNARQAVDPYTDDHAAHIAVLSSFQRGTITRLADPQTEMPPRPRPDGVTHTGAAGGGP